MNISKAEKQKRILAELETLATMYSVPPLRSVTFDADATYYDAKGRTIHFDSRVYNRVGRTLMYHEFAHHVCNVRHGLSRANHTSTFWEVLDHIVTHCGVTYPWLLEYISGVKYYAKRIIPRLPARKRARALYQVRELNRLSTGG